MDARERIQEIVINLQGYIDEAKDWVSEARHKIDDFTDRLREARDEINDLIKVLEDLNLREVEPTPLPTEPQA